MKTDGFHVNQKIATDDCVDLSRLHFILDDTVLSGKCTPLLTAQSTVILQG